MSTDDEESDTSGNDFDIRFVDVGNAASKVAVGIFGMPDVGLVGSISTSYLSSTLGAKEAAQVASDYLPPLMILHNGEPKEVVRMFSSPQANILVAETPMPSALTAALVIESLKWFRNHGASEVYCIGGVAVEDRVDIEKPEVYVVSTSAQRRVELRQRGLNVMDEGVVAGPFAVVMREALKMGLTNTLILSQAFQNLPDPESALAALEALTKAGGPRVDLDPLRKMSDQIKLKSKELIQKAKEVDSGQKEANVPLMYG